MPPIVHKDSMVNLYNQINLDFILLLINAIYEGIDDI